MKTAKETNKAQDFIDEKFNGNNWGFYPPSRRAVGEWLEEYASQSVEAERKRIYDNTIKIITFIIDNTNPPKTQVDWSSLENKGLDNKLTSSDWPEAFPSDKPNQGKTMEKEVQSITEAFSQQPAFYYIGIYVNGKQIETITLEKVRHFINGEPIDSDYYVGRDDENNVLFEFRAESVNVIYK